MLFVLDANQNIFAGACTGLHAKFDAMECLGLAVLKMSNHLTPENLEQLLHFSDHKHTLLLRADCISSLSMCLGCL